MSDRMVRVVVGDWSDDGHGKTSTHVVRVSGTDVSDEALRASYLETVKLTGTDLSRVCEDYEDSSIDEDLYERLLEAGYVAPTRCPGPEIFVRNYSDIDVYIPALSLLLFYVGRSIENFTWEVVRDEIPTLIGGWSTIVHQTDFDGKTLTGTTNFGYGLFQ